MGAWAVGQSGWHVSCHRSGRGHVYSAFSQYLQCRVPWVGIHIYMSPDPGQLTSVSMGRQRKKTCVALWQPRGLHNLMEDPRNA